MMAHIEGPKRSVRLRSKQVEREIKDEQGTGGMSLDVLAHVASETLRKEPQNSRKKIQSKKMSMKAINLAEVLTLDQIVGLTEKTVMNLFTETVSNEMARTFTYTCHLIPRQCKQQYTSFGNEMKARSEMKKHIYEHLNQLEMEDSSVKSKFTAEPVPVRNKRLMAYHVPKKKLTQFPAPKPNPVETKIIGDNVFISKLGKKKSAIGFIPDPDKMESLAVSKENFLKNFKSVVNDPATIENLVEEKESKIEENEQFIIDLLSKTQPHHDHNYTTVFGKRKNTEQVEELMNSLEDEKKVVHNWKQHLIKLGLAKRVIFIDPPDSYKRNKKKPVPILFLRHRSPDENVPMVSAEEIIEEEPENPEGSSEEEGFVPEPQVDMSAAEECFSTGQKPYPPMPKSLLARKGRLGFDIQDISPDSSDNEDLIKIHRRSLNPLAREGREGNLGWEPTLALKYIKEMKAKRKEENMPLRCKICNDKTFTATATLMYHYRSHAGIKPFVCLICNTTFTRQHSLNYHMLIHNNQSRFTCKDCGRKFRHPSHFKEHLRRHTGETPFVCADCGQKFKTRNTYKRHLKTRHGKLLTASGIHQMSDEEFAKVRTRRYTIPRLPDISYQMPELTFTQLKAKRTGEVEIVFTNKSQSNNDADKKGEIDESVIDRVILEELKADIKKETDETDSDPELNDILEALQHSERTGHTNGSGDISRLKSAENKTTGNSPLIEKKPAVLYVNNSIRT